MKIITEKLKAVLSEAINESVQDVILNTDEVYQLVSNEWLNFIKTEISAHIFLYAYPPVIQVFGPDFLLDDGTVDCIEKTFNINFDYPNHSISQAQIDELIISLRGVNELIERLGVIQNELQSKIDAGPTGKI